MQRFIVLLRGINVSGKNKLLMQDLRDVLNQLDFKNVKTYIQSGNIIVDADKTKQEVAYQIKTEIKNKFDYDVPVIVKTSLELEKAVEKYPFPLENEKIVAFSFLDRIPENLKVSFDNVKEDKIKIDKAVVYLYCPNGFGKSKITNNLLERKLKVIATTRNLRTTLKLIELAKE